MTRPNIALLRKVVEWVEAQAALPENQRQWNQAYYFMPAWRISRDEVECGTCYCVAGYVGQMLDDRYTQDAVVDDIHVSDYAADALGLPSSFQGYPGTHPLFNADNTARDVRRIAEEVAGEPL